MIKSLVQSWDDNKVKIRKELKEKLIESRCVIRYEELVEITFKHLTTEKHNHDYNFNIDKITVINDGHYQGTLIYMIPIKTYQPSLNDYYYTHNYYGSCSGCDTLMHILGWKNEPNEDMINDLMQLCLGLVQQTKQFGD